MDAIISPTWFYLIHVSDVIYNSSAIVLCISVPILLLLLFGIFFTTSNSDLEKMRVLVVKGIKICTASIVVCTLVLILIPDRKTIYAMIAASVITPDNISITEDHIVDFISRIAEVVRETK
jgi:hypothetical protein